MFKLPDLPYPYNALEPHIDERTMRIHHTKHHAAYVANLNEALKGHNKLLNMEINELIRNLDRVPEDIRTRVRNNGGGHANHSLFWTIMSPNGSSTPKGAVANLINSAFGNFSKFKEEFTNVAMGVFGSGWAWLALNKDEELAIVKTANQDSPVSQGQLPLLGVDLWEHSYYLKHKWNRAAYLEDFFQVINWNRVSERLKKGQQ